MPTPTWQEMHNYQLAFSNKSINFAPHLILKDQSSWLISRHLPRSLLNHLLHHNVCYHIRTALSENNIKSILNFSSIPFWRLITNKMIHHKHWNVKVKSNRVGLGVFSLHMAIFFLLEVEGPLFFFWLLENKEFERLGRRGEEWRSVGNLTSLWLLKPNWLLLLHKAIIWWHFNYFMQEK